MADERGKGRLGRCHASNSETLAEIMGLVNNDGGLFSGTEKVILDAIARFPREQGNYMGSKQLGMITSVQMTRRTLERHLGYLEDEAGVIHTDVNGARRLVVPEKKQFRSFRQYQTDKGCSEYSYRQKKDKNMATTSSGQRQDDPNGRLDNLPNTCDKLPNTLDNLPNTCDKLPNTLGFFQSQDEKKAEVVDLVGLQSSRRTTNGEESNRLNITTPYPLLCGPNGKEPASRAPGAGLPGRPQGEGVRPRASQDVPISSPEAMDEPLLHKPRRRRAKNRQERMEEAAELIRQGHIANPLGVTEIAGRKLCSKRARPIGENGAVTLAQLWREFEECYDSAFGTPGMLKTILNPTKENVGAYFDGVKQKFIDACGYDPSYRELVEYVRWFLEPGRLKSLLDATKRADLHPNQLAGAIHVRRFYDQVLRKRASGSDLFVSDGVRKQREVTDFAQEAFDAFRRTSDGTPAQVVLQMVNYGVVLYAEFLRDEKGLNASGCKGRIIDVVAGFLRGSSDPARAAEMAARSMEPSRRNALVPCSVWPDWKVACADVMALAKDKAGIRDERQA